MSTSTLNIPRDLLIFELVQQQIPNFSVQLYKKRENIHIGYGANCDSFILGIYTHSLLVCSNCLFHNLIITYKIAMHIYSIADRTNMYL